MTMHDEDEAIARTCGCGQFDEEADEHWEDLTAAERWEIGKRQAVQQALRDEMGAILTEALTWSPGPQPEEVPF